MTAPWRAKDDGVLIDVRLTPRGGKDAIDGVVHSADGASMLAVRVRAPPADGMANAALKALIARTLKVPPSRVSIIAGHAARLKTLRVEGETIALMAVLEQLPAPRSERA